MSISFRIDILDERSVNAVIEFVEPEAQEIETEETALGAVARSARVAELWSTARSWFAEYQSPIKRRARSLQKAALELTQAALELKQTTAITALEQYEATVANTLELKQVTAASAQELKATAKVATAKVVATTNVVRAGLNDVTNHLSSRTQQLAEGPAAQKASALLDDARVAGANVYGKIQQNDMVRTVSSGAGSIASSIHEFISIQRF